MTRRAELTIPAGQHTVWLRGLPSVIDPASIRIEGLSEGGLTIGSADLRRAPADTQASGEQAERLKALRGDLARSQGRIGAIEAEKKAVVDFARLAAEAAAKGAQGFDLAQARAAWSAVGEGTASANEALRLETARSQQIEAEIRALDAAAGRPRPGAAPLVDLAIAVEAARDGTARLAVTYRVTGARWLPIYDATLDSSGPGPAASVALVRRAAISQRTGEDWTDVEMTLSTARVTGGATAPTVTTQALSLRDPVVLFEAAPAQRQRSLAAPARPDALQAAPPAPMAAEMAPAVEQEAAAQASAFSASFTVPGRTSVARDGTQRTLRLSSHALEAALLARVAPSLETKAYLSAGLTWTDEVPLLPGEVNLSRDGVHVGKGRIGAVAAGDVFELGFGADERIKVERVPVRRRDNDPSGWNATRTQISDHRTIVTNLHRRPMRIGVIDRMPVSENAAITVEALSTNTTPTERIVQDRRGVMGWTWDYGPGEKREIRLGWRLRWPADRELVTQ